MSQYCFGVDVGGTTIKMGVFDPEGKVLDKWEIPTRTENNGDKILPDIAAAVQKKMEEMKIDLEKFLGIDLFKNLTGIYDLLSTFSTPSIFLIES